MEIALSSVGKGQFSYALKGNLVKGFGRLNVACRQTKPVESINIPCQVCKLPPRDEFSNHFFFYFTLL